LVHVKSMKGILECRIKENSIKGIKSTNPIAVGDVVDYEIDETSDVITGTILISTKKITSFVSRLICHIKCILPLI
jgi:hypothetical protein